MKITPYKYTLLLSLIIAVFSILKVQAGELISIHESHNLVGSHGMVLIHDDKEGFFVSHLPLYSHPHNFQIIYKVQIYEADKIFDLLGNGIVTLLPNNFDLSRLVKGESFSMNATFYQGHFERGGIIKFTTKILFEDPVLIKRIDPKFNSASSIIYTIPISNQLEVFAHKIQQAPSFDTIGFIDSEEIKRYNNKNEDGVEYLTCNPPTRLTTQEITKSFETCQPFKIKYIETKDFN